MSKFWVSVVASILLLIMMGCGVLIGIHLERSPYQWNGETKKYWWLGDGKGRIIQIEGSPDTVVTERKGSYEIWWYGYDKIYFHDGKVVEYSNPQGSLNPLAQYDNSERIQSE